MNQTRKLQRADHVQRMDDTQTTSDGRVEGQRRVGKPESAEDILLTKVNRAHFRGCAGGSQSVHRILISWNPKMNLGSYQKYDMYGNGKGNDALRVFYRSKSKR